MLSFFIDTVIQKPIKLLSQFSVVFAPKKRTQSLDKFYKVLQNASVLKRVEF